MHISINIGFFFLVTLPCTHFNSLLYQFVGGLLHLDNI